MMKLKIKKNKDLGVYKVGDYKINDVVSFIYGDGEGGEGCTDNLKIEGFSDDGEEVYGYFDSDDCGGTIKYKWITGIVN